MKALFLLGLMSANLYASPFSIVPDKMVTPFLDIFSSSNKQLSAEQMEVRVSAYNKKGEISKGTQKFQMPIEQYLKARKQASAVLRMMPSESSANADGMIYMGTAFHIGENLVLTNQHVLSPDWSNKSECGGFQLYANTSSDIFPCKKVHYCNEENDVCLIEMGATKKCLNFFCTKTEVVELKQGEALKIKAIPMMSYENMDGQVMTCIGNTMGLGIHYSQGRGLRNNGDRIYFFAPLRTGNSGGPLIGEDGLVWGVVKQESQLKMGPEAYNVAASMEKVISLMREQLSMNKVTLDKFNKAVADE
jgi:hypothetical protein